MIKTIEWIWQFESHPVADGDVAGQVFETMVGGHPATVHLPTVVVWQTIDSERDELYLAPSTVNEITDQLIPPDWGYVRQRAGNQPVAIAFHGVVLKVEADCHDSREFNQLAQELVDASTEWQQTVEAWIEVSTGQVLTRIGHQPTIRIGCVTHIWERSGANGGIQRLAIPTSADFPATTTTPAVTRDSLHRCFELAGKRVRPALAWMLIRDARSLNAAGQHRRAIIDAGSAAEIAVKQLIRSQLSSTPDELVDKLANATLGQSLDTLKLAGWLPPAGLNLRSDLVTPRNQVVHLKSSSTDAPSDQAATSAIRAATALVESAFPHPQGLVS
ncbi:hypothetical protein ACFVJ5_07560 [Nocardia sp. NPDC127606]|uniref:hypothetical protein n=1 Tax=Nocardia sp. NPDC127606 TaxID=3345406 RepID=UPI00363499C5